jgi:nucleoside-diphosphate-sugar epimerase
LTQKVKPTHVLHFAWIATPGKFWTAPENLDWVKATIYLMQMFYEQGGQRVVMAGSCAEYDWSYSQCSELSTPCRPATLYGTAKLSAQIILEAWTRRTGMSGAWGRIFFLYGPDEYSSRLVPSVINSLINGEPALCTHGEQIRDFMYVKDVAAAFVALLNSGVQGVVNIASGVPVSLKDVIYGISDQLKRPDLVRLGSISANLSEPKVLVADITRLNDEVGFRRQFKLSDGIALTISSMKGAVFKSHE